MAYVIKICWERFVEMIHFKYGVKEVKWMMDRESDMCSSLANSRWTRGILLLACVHTSLSDHVLKVCEPVRLCTTVWISPNLHWCIWGQRWADEILRSKGQRWRSLMVKWAIWEAFCHLSPQYMEIFQRNSSVTHIHVHVTPITFSRSLCQKLSQATTA